MTANEMRNLFKELYDGASAQEMGYDDIEVSRFFNLAQILIFNEKFFSNRNALREGFEIGSKRDNELNNLKRNLTLWYDLTLSEWVIRDESGILLEGDEVNLREDDEIMADNAVFFNSPEQLLYILRDTADIKYDDEMYRNIPVKNLNEDEINDVLNNPFKKPDITVIYRTSQVNDETIEAEIESFKTIKLYLPENSYLYRWNCSYIKRPRDIVVDILDPDNQIDCELDEVYHNDIVIKSVELAMGAIGSQKTELTIHNTNRNIT